MSTSTRACYDFSVPVHHKSPGNAVSQGFFGSAAIACLVVGCAWTVYANVFGASVYPALSNGNFDVPWSGGHRHSPAATCRLSPATA